MKILLITTQYPCFDSKDLGHTEFMHMYNRAFVRSGHQVTVFHLERKYPAIFGWFARILIRLNHKFKRLLGHYLNDDAKKHDNHYSQDGVSIYRVVVRKYIPHGNFAPGSLKRAKKIFRKITTETKCLPDIVIAEFANPSLLFLDLFPDVPFAYSPHGSDFAYLKKNPKFQAIAGRASLILAKSTGQANKLSAFFDTKKMVMLYGLVPESLVKEKPKERAKITKYITVSRLVKGKNITKVIDALSIDGLNDFEFTIIGDGPEKEDIARHISQSNISGKCVMLGQLAKEEVLKHLGQSDCFIMISKPETFGLVYIEAMASGCITIGSKNQGIDGVIIDDVNGYLCQPGDVDHLSRILAFLSKQTADKLERISLSGYETAARLSDERYPEFIIKCMSDAIEGKV